MPHDASRKRDAKGRGCQEKEVSTKKWPRSTRCPEPHQKELLTERDVKRTGFKAKNHDLEKNCGNQLGYAAGHAAFLQAFLE